MSRFWKFLTSLTQPPPTKLDERAKLFNLVADEYDRARPEYSPIIFDLMDSSFKNNCKAVADIGAGTGKLTSLLTQYLDPTARIYAVEPLEKLREKLSENFAQNDNVKIYNSLSDKLAFIEDDSLDAIFVGSAFHWFANISTMKEFERVLNGKDAYLMIVWNQLDWNKTLFFQKVKQILGEEVDRDDAIRRKIQRLLTPQNLIDNGIKSFEQFKYKKIANTHFHTMDGHLFLELIMSRSRWQVLDEYERELVINQIKAEIVSFFDTPDAEIVVPYSTLVTYAKCNK